MREILGQMELEVLQKVFKNFHYNVPGEEVLRSLRLYKPDLTLEELMIEILIEEDFLKRYVSNSLASVAIMPTHEDMWKEGQIEVEVVNAKIGQLRYINLEDLRLREFDRMM